MPRTPTSALWGNSWVCGSIVDIGIDAVGSDTSRDEAWRRHPIDVIARQTGFADRDRTRRAFLCTFGQPQQVIRRNARAEVAA
jgi:hypothetical protein